MCSPEATADLEPALVEAGWLRASSGPSSVHLQRAPSSHQKNSGRPEGRLTKVSWTDELDPHFARAWSEYTGGLVVRQVLTERVRLLVAIGECTMIGEVDAVVNLARRALDAGVPVGEIHEVLLQACIYAGRPVVDRSLNAFADLISGAGLRDELM